MREFKKNTWTLIKRLSLGLALAVPGLYQGHAQAQNIVLNFSGTIQNPICILRVQNSSLNSVTTAGVATLPLGTLTYSEVYAAAQGGTIGSPTLFRVNVTDTDGSLCKTRNPFQVTLLANAGDVKTINGNPVLTSSSNREVGVLISVLDQNYVPLASLPAAVSAAETSQGNSNLSTLQARAQSISSFLYSAQPVKLAAANTAITPGSYGGQLTVQATFY